MEDFLDFRRGKCEKCPLAVLRGFKRISPKKILRTIERINSDIFLKNQAPRIEHYGLFKMFIITCRLRLLLINTSGKSTNA
jgi:hypothetical protein